MKILINIIILAAFCIPAIIIAERLLVLAAARAACTPLAAAAISQACTVASARTPATGSLLSNATTTSNQVRFVARHSPA